MRQQDCDQFQKISNIETLSRNIIILGVII